MPHIPECIFFFGLSPQTTSLALFLLVFKENSFSMKKTIIYLFPILLCMLVGFSASIFQSSAISEWYPLLNKSVLTPPNLAFPIVWGVLYICIGLSLGRLTARGQGKGLISLWVAQLIVNFLWSIFFFYFRNPLIGFIDIIVLDLLVIAYIFWAARRDRAAAWLFVPYLLWILLATYLNGYILINN